MSKAVKEIHLVLENCEFIVVPTKYLADVVIEDITQKISREAINSVSKSLTAKSVYLEILKPSDLKVVGLMREDRDYTCKERISDGGDITCLQVVYKDDSYEDYWVEWNHSSDYYNSYQKVEFSKEGNLHLLIHKDKTLEKYLNELEEDYYDYKMNEDTNMEFGFWE